MSNKLQLILPSNYARVVLSISRSPLLQRQRIRGLHRDGNSRFPFSHENPTGMGIDMV